MNQIPLFVEEGIVSGPGQPESLRPGTEKAGKFDPAAGIDRFVSSRLHDQTRTAETSGGLAGVASDDQQVGRSLGGKPGIGEEKLGGLWLAGGS